MSDKRKKCVQAVKQALHEVKSVDPASVREDAMVIQQLGLESIDLVDLGYEIERILGVTFDLVEFFDSIRPPGKGFYVDFTLSQLITYVEKKVG